MKLGKVRGEFKEVVLGLGVSGRAAVEFLVDEGRPPYVVAKEVSSEAINYLSEKGVEVTLQGQEFSWSEFLSERKVSRIVVSPGISPHSKILSEPCLNNLEIVTDIDLFFEKIKSTGNTRLRIVGVTGTNGKTSVVELISFLFNALGLKSKVAGNIGDSPLTDLSEWQDSLDFVVMELSSYQLYYAKNLSLEAAVLTSFSEDHLDWHGSLEEYRAAKLKTVNFLTSSSSPVVVAEGCSESYFTKQGPQNLIVVAESEALEQLGFFKKFSKIERLNVSLAIAVVEGVLKRALVKDEIECFSKFNFPKYRNQRFLFPDLKRKFINDSKSTNLESTVVALNNVDEPVHLLLGGLAKNPDFSSLESLQKRISKISLFGKDGGKILESLKGTCLHDRAQVYSTLKRGLEALKKDRGDETVLFSPGCASFDEFSGYSERGGFVVDYLNLIVAKKDGFV